MTQFFDEHSTAIEAKGLEPQKISYNSTHYLIVGRHKMKYLTQIGRDKDYERQLKNK